MTQNKLASQSLETKQKWKTTDNCETDCKVKVVDPRQSKSFPECPNCKKRGIFKKTKVFDDVFARWNLEMKLSHYKIEFTKSKHLLNCLRKHFISAKGLNNVSWKFSLFELTKLDFVQLGRLKGSLEKLLEIRNRELGVELEEKSMLTNDQQLLKKKSMELECLARDIMKPYINIHPLCEELSRLMLA